MNTNSCLSYDIQQYKKNTSIISICHIILILSIEIELFEILLSWKSISFFIDKKKKKKSYKYISNAFFILILTQETNRNVNITESRCFEHSFFGNKSERKNGWYLLFYGHRYLVRSLCRLIHWFFRRILSRFAIPVNIILFFKINTFYNF